MTTASNSPVLVMLSGIDFEWSSMLFHRYATGLILRIQHGDRSVFKIVLSVAGLEFRIGRPDRLSGTIVDIEGDSNGLLAVGNDVRFDCKRRSDGENGLNGPAEMYILREGFNTPTEVPAVPIIRPIVGP